MQSNILVLPGDLQKYSPSWYLADQASRILSAKSSTQIFMPDLPLFSEELERDAKEPVHPAVEELRALLREADGMLVCASEYNHLPSPALLNALLWVTREPHPPLLRKPVMIAGASLDSEGTRASRPLLRDALRRAGALVIDQDIFVGRSEETFSSSENIALLQDDLRDKLSELLRFSQKAKLLSWEQSPEV